MWKQTVRNDISNGQDRREARRRTARIWRPTAMRIRPGALRDWDYSYEHSCKLDSTMNQNTTVDDVDSNVVYSTSPVWNNLVWSGQSPQPLMGTNHGTPNPGAIATFTFNGTAVYVYGYKAGDHGYRDVSIDGANPVTCDGRTGSQGSRALVYWADGLSLGMHEITLKHTGTQGQYLNIDYFFVTTPGGDSTATIAGSGPAYASTQNNNAQSSSPIGIIVGVLVTATVASLLAAAWFLWRRRKSRLQLEKTGRTELDGGTARGVKRMAVVAGATADPRIIDPFYASVPGPLGQGHPNATPVFNPQNRQRHPESPSGSASPPNQTHFAPLYLYAPPTTTGTAYTASTVPDPCATPSATSSSGKTASETSQTPITGPSMSKARYSGANSLGASSTSRPLSPPAIDDSVPPPQYEL